MVWSSGARRWAGRLMVLVAALAALPPVEAQAAPGELDPSFGTGGIVRTPLNHAGRLRGAALDAEDRIVVAGTEETFGVVVARYLKDGGLDAAFDGDGIATAAFPGFSQVEGIGVVLDASRRPLVLARGLDGQTFQPVTLLARFTTTGALDLTFGMGGRTSVPTLPNPAGLGLLADGRIVVAGSNANGFAAVRMSPVGQVDAAYGTNGIASLPFAGDVSLGSANDALVDASGRAVIAGTLRHGAGAQRYAVARFAADGRADTTFDGDGLAEVPFGGGDASSSAIAVAPGGALVVAGDANGNTTFGVARLREDGALDRTFDGDGLVTTALPGYANASGTAVQVAADGRVNVAGYGRAGQSLAFVLARYLPSGALDTAAAGGGLTITASLNGHASALVAQSGGRLVGAGTSTPVGTTSTQATLVGYQSGATAPPPATSTTSTTPGPSSPTTTPTSPSTPGATPSTAPATAPQGFVPAPPARYTAPTAPVGQWRIQGIDVTQGTQEAGVPQPNQGGGVYSVKYSGVKLAKGGRTLARVFVDAKVNVTTTLTGYGPGGAKLGTLTPRFSYWPIDRSSSDVNTKQQLFYGGYQFELPASWAQRTLRLVAHVDPVDPKAKCARPECGDVSLTGVAFTPVRPVKVRLVALLDNGVYPPGGAEALGRAFSLAPQGDKPIDIPMLYAGTLEVGDLKTGSTTCFLWSCKFRDRTAANSATLERLQDWDEANKPAGGNKNVDITIGVSGDPDVGISNGTSVFPFLGLPQGCSIGGIGSLFLCTRPVIAISQADADFLHKGRPLTNAGHEIFHALGRPHAGSACKSGSLFFHESETWPPDETGRLNGVGLDFGSLYGPPIPFLPAGFGSLYRVVPPRISQNYDAAEFRTDYVYDLMSYCGSNSGGGDPYSWISPHNWNAVVDKLATGKAGARAAARANAVRAATTAEPIGPRMVVDVLQTEAGTGVVSMRPTTGLTAAVPDPAAVPHAVFRDAQGAVVSDTPMETRRTHADATGGAAPVTMLRAVAPLPAAGVAGLTIEQDGKVLDERRRSAHPPTVATVRLAAANLARGGLTKRRRFTLTWRAADADGDTRQATVAYAPDGRTFRTLHIGVDRGRAVLPTEVLTPGRRARFRVTVDDGFDRAAAVSPPVLVPARPPLIGIFGLPKGRRLGRGQTLVLRGQAAEVGGSVVAPERLRWYAGRRLAGRGSLLRVTMPRKGVLRLRLEARGSSGLLGRAVVVLTPGRGLSPALAKKVTTANAPGPKPAPAD